MTVQAAIEESATPVPHARYETIALIGRGGMAEVFLSAMVSAGGITKLAVLKRIWPELAADPRFLAMFLDEARLSVRLAHPNLVQTFEVVEEDSGLAIAMEYLHGQPLGRVLNRLRGAQALSLPQRVRIVTKVLAGLDYVHELTDYDGTPLSVVHRDVSPNNIFVTYDGSVKLVDFGIAKSVADDHQTRPGTVKGKLSYMAPEQFLGQIADRRSDIFAVGVILWEMLAGRRFWSGIADHAIAAQLLSDRSLPALPAELGLPVEFEVICARALSRDREKRYATAAEMEADLEEVMTNTPEASDRLLGKAVAESFATERADRQVLIDRTLRKIGSGTYPLRSGSYPAAMGAMLTPSVSLPAIEIPAPVPRAPFRRVALSLAFASPIFLLGAFFSGIGWRTHGPRPLTESLPRAVAGQSGPSVPGATAEPDGVGLAAPRVVVIDRSDSRDSPATDVEGARPDEPARPKRQSPAPQAPQHRGASPATTVAPSAGPPAPRADARLAQPPGPAQPRPIEMVSPFKQLAHPQPRLIDMTSPFVR